LGYRRDGVHELFVRSGRIAGDGHMHGVAFELSGTASAPGSHDYENVIRVVRSGVRNQLKSDRATESGIDRSE